MEIVLLIFVLVILIVLFRNLSGVKDDLYSLHNELLDVKKLFDTKHPEETQKSHEKVTTFSDPNAFKPRIPVKEEIKKEELPEVFVGETKQERVLPPNRPKQKLFIKKYILQLTFLLPQIKIGSVNGLMTILILKNSLVKIS